MKERTLKIGRRWKRDSTRKTELDLASRFIEAARIVEALRKSLFPRLRTERGANAPGSANATLVRTPPVVRAVQVRQSCAGGLRGQLGGRRGTPPRCSASVECPRAGCRRRTMKSARLPGARLPIIRSGPRYSAERLVAATIAEVRAASAGAPPSPPARAVRRSRRDDPRARCRTPRMNPAARRPWLSAGQAALQNRRTSPRPAGRRRRRRVT